VIAKNSWRDWALAAAAVKNDQNSFHKSHHDGFLSWS
jgi:hypothetical protein